LARLAEPAPPATLAPALEEATRRILPPPLRPYVERSLTALDWRRRTWSLEEARLACRTPGHRFSLVRLPPKASFPRHSHLGREYTLVLSGSYADASGQYAAGDFEYADGSFEHDLRSEEGCICVIALDAGVRFAGLFGALVNPFAPKTFD
jgi:putative transcriptional regulator